MSSTNEELKTVLIDGQEIPYYLKTNMNGKNIILKVTKGKIRVSAPDYTSKRAIENIIIDNIDSLQEQIGKFDARIKKYDMFSSHPWIMIFDQKVPVIISDKNVNTKVTKDGIVMKNYYSEEIQIDKLFHFLAKYYKNWFVKETLHWADIMGLTFDSLTIKKMTAKWGACYSARKALIFNTALLHFSKEVIDSVIVHELAHLVHPDHSKEFWEYVYHYYPDYKKCKKILDAAGGI